MSGELTDSTTFTHSFRVKYVVCSLTKVVLDLNEHSQRGMVTKLDKVLCFMFLFAEYNSSLLRSEKLTNRNVLVT